MSVFVSIGHCAGPHGVKGFLKVIPLSEDPDRFEELESVFFMTKDGKRREEFEIESVRVLPDRVLVKLVGIDDRTQAESFKGKIVQLPEEEIEPIEDEDTWYYYQLEGMTVEDTQGEVLGILDSVFQTGSNDIYNVRTPEGKEFMVPALKKCVLKVDVSAKRMVVDRQWVL